jgi:hypothetical protein
VVLARSSVHRRKKRLASTAPLGAPRGADRGGRQAMHCGPVWLGATRRDAGASEPPVPWQVSGCAHRAAHLGIRLKVKAASSVRRAVFLFGTDAFVIWYQAPASRSDAYWLDVGVRSSGSSCCSAGDSPCLQTMIMPRPCGAHNTASIEPPATMSDRAGGG